MTNDERFAAWGKQIQAVYDETVSLFWSRKLFRAVRSMFMTNEPLASTGQHVWKWIAGMYARDASMLVRRELDKQARVLNLRSLLHDIEKHHGTLVACSQARRVPARDEVARDRAELEAATAKVRDYAERFLAHRTSTEEAPVTWEELDTAIKAVLRVLRRYYAYLLNTDIAWATPTPQFDWVTPFRMAWAPASFNEDPDDDEV